MHAVVTYAARGSSSAFDMKSAMSKMRKTGVVKEKCVTSSPYSCRISRTRLDQDMGSRITAIDGAQWLIM